jgi:multicomponent Na+:H+ antiporter subunit A
VFWELTSVTSFLLIGFDHEREKARRGAIQALIVTGIGGLALMAAGVLLHAITGTWTISDLASSPIGAEAQWLYPVVLALVMAAAFTKSAQWPFHFWLPNAMEAPTPVSAYLHSATMVQGGVYLLARLSPMLAGTPYWQVPLCTIGGITLLWGGIVALRQTDLKQILAQTTIASLGLSVLLLGIGGASAAMAVATYFVAHALYKAALFMVAGIIDHGTGTRDITQLGGLRDVLTISFICTALAAFSMFGVPPLVGYLAKEEIYAALSYGDAGGIVTIVVMVLGNALLGAVALVLAIKPFMGPLKPTPAPPHEGGFTLWIGPAILGLAGLGVVFLLSVYDELLFVPMAASIVGEPVASHLSFLPKFDALPIWLSAATWLLGIAIYLSIDRIRAFLVAIDGRVTWTWDKGFDQAMFGLVRFAGAWTRAIHHGRLELYLLVIVALLSLALIMPLALIGGWPAMPEIPRLAFHEWGAVALAAAGVVMVVTAHTRIGAIIALGVQGLAVALIFLFFGAPDLAFTQLMVETLAVVILALVMTRLNLSVHDRRVFEDWLRDGGLSLLAGASVTVLLIKVLEGTFDGRLSQFFLENSVPVAHGHNVVNVILVDFRGLDTLGEISVVMTAGIAVLALLRRQHKRVPLQPTRRAKKETAA